jgi:glycogen debranching enzyme
VGQLPEILDGDAPHLARGCDAQAWSVTETLRVWLLLSRAGDGALPQVQRSVPPPRPGQ